MVVVPNGFRWACMRSVEMKLHVLVIFVLRKIWDEDLHQLTHSHRINSRRPTADDLSLGLDDHSNIYGM